MCQFSVKTDNFDFLAQIYPKRKLEFEITKTNAGIRITIFEIPCVQIFRQNEQLWLFGPKFAQNLILGSKFQKSKSGFGIDTSNIPCVPIFSQNGQLLMFRSKFREIAQLRAIFWFKYCWGCCRQLSGGWNKLGRAGWCWIEVKWAGWRWMELGGAGWGWMELGGRGCTL